MKDIDTWFNSWERVASVALSALVLYVAIIVISRLAGKRMTSQMNNFDWVVTVAMGGLVSAGILFENVSVADALSGIIALTLVQWVTTSLVLRSEPLARAVKARPALLLHNGEFLAENMRRERVTEAEIYAAVRSAGLLALEDAACVVLESDATFSIMPRHDGAAPADLDVLKDVAGRSG